MKTGLFILIIYTIIWTVITHLVLKVNELFGIIFLVITLILNIFLAWELGKLDYKTSEKRRKRNDNTRNSN